MLTSEDGTIRRVNATFCGWTGRSPESLVDRLRLSDLLTMGGRLFHQTHWAPLLQMQGSVAEVKLEIVHADGRRVPMLLNALRRRHGDTVYHELATLIVTDRHRYEQELLLERKKAEQALERANVSESALRTAEAVAAGRALFAGWARALGGAGRRLAARAGGRGLRRADVRLPGARAGARAPRRRPMPRRWRPPDPDAREPRGQRLQLRRTRSAGDGDDRGARRTAAAWRCAPRRKKARPSRSSCLPRPPREG